MWTNVAIDLSIYFLSLSLYILVYALRPPSLPLIAGGALLAPVLHPSSWFNTGTDVVESLRGPLVPLVQQQGWEQQGKTSLISFIGAALLG